MAPAELFDFQARQSLAALQAEVDELKKRPQGKDGNGMTSDMSDDLIDHKIALSEARQETKLTRLEGKIDLLGSAITTLGIKIDGQRSDASANRNLIIVTMIASTLSMLALVYAILSYGASTFASGTTVRDIIHAESNAVGGKPPAAKP